MGPVMALCLAVELLWVAGTAAAEAGEAYDLVVAPVGPQNPRNSEAAIIQLKNGSLLLAWTEFYAGSGADHGPARIVGRVSADNGRTWGDKYTLVENDGGCNVMEVNFLRLNSGPIALFHCQKNTSATDCRIMMRTSAGRRQDLDRGPATEPRKKVHGTDQRPLHPPPHRAHPAGSLGRRRQLLLPLGR